MPTRHRFLPLIRERSAILDCVKRLCSLQAFVFNLFMILFAVRLYQQVTPLAGVSPLSVTYPAMLRMLIRTHARLSNYVC